MADQGSTEQLLELLIQLKKTTPKAARDILNSQPAIAYALINLMVSMGAINIEVFQKTLSQFHESNPRGQATLQASATSTPPITALPPHLQTQYGTSTPPPAVGTPPAGVYGGYPSQQAYQPPPTQSYPPAASSSANYPAYGGQPQSQPAYPSYPPPQTYSTPTPQTAPPAASTGGRPASAPIIKPETLAAFPDDQKALIMHVISMTQEQLNMLPLEQRNTYIQIRATLGIS
ncbi:hypothetical protein AGABI2DRAFT_193985 [Agaricus bisporus var. bisporus H97]|uniref:hypothetical protein n=1 Tax=Agaricus bisporus var. bisporus (strain H97 / ATCC MYA-4626 / FGSC 10389) TaxID=936046 RepID=UPI00029F5083|nr:hypothetical protein AGABI2DRAFT_193985 [Agaricus bisporus var. bisporus H97]EKV46110.1 hypothetical protein AGABI2DRAFT_193985 [Agaricus bisporus var. bisporus H97]